MTKPTKCRWMNLYRRRDCLHTIHVIIIIRNAVAGIVFTTHDTVIFYYHIGAYYDYFAAFCLYPNIYVNLAVSVINYQLRKDAFSTLREMNAFAYCVIKRS